MARERHKREEIIYPLVAAALGLAVFLTITILEKTKERRQTQIEGDFDVENYDLVRNGTMIYSK